MTAGKVATAGPGPQRIRRGVAVGFVLVVGLVVAGSRAGADTEVHLTAAGDFGARAATDGVLRKVAELDPDAHLALGDLAYQDVATEDAWCSYVKARTGEGFPFQLLAGNHESLDVPDGAINDFSACLPNQVPGAAGTYGRQYHFDLPSAQDPMVRVIQISPGLTFEDGLWSYAAGSPRLQWVSDAIDSGRAAGANWIVVSAHLPCFSVGGYGCPTAQKDLYDLLVAKRVDVVLHGHEHAYMRTHQLRSGAGCATVPAGGFDADCVSDSDGAFTAGAGTVFATVGTGGIPLRNIDPNDAEAGYFAAFSGLNANPTFGLLDLRFTESSLTAQFVGTSGEGFSDSFTIAQGPPNQPPTAAFTSTASGLDVSVDATGSTDPEGGALAYLWDFGDGGTATGATASHTYPASGTYTVTLTVTDAGGATGSTSSSVTVTAPGGPIVLARDQFERTTSGGWGSAELGGTWATTGSGSWYSVTGGQGRHALSGGRTAATRLPTLADVSITARVKLSFTAAPTGGGYYSYLNLRRNGTTSYQLRPRFMPGSTTLTLFRVLNGSSTSLGSVTVPGGAHVPGQVWELELSASQTSPTTLSARLWNSASPRPATPQITATDSTAALQQPGGLELSTYLSSSSTGAPTALFDDLVVTSP